MSLVVLAALAVAAVLLVRLHLAATGLSPARDAVSEYGTTEWHIAYREQAVALGIAAIGLAIELRADTDAGSLYWLYAYGVSTLVLAGLTHWVLLAVAYASIAFAATSIDWTGAPGVLEPLGVAVGISALATLVTRLAPGCMAGSGLRSGRCTPRASCGWRSRPCRCCSAGIRAPGPSSLPLDGPRARPSPSGLRGRALIAR